MNPNETETTNISSFKKSPKRLCSLSNQALELAYNIRCDMMHVDKDNYIISWIRGENETFVASRISNGNSGANVRFGLQVLVTSVRDMMKHSATNPFVSVRTLDLSFMPASDHLIIDLLEFTINRNGSNVEVLNLTSSGITEDTLNFLSENLFKFPHLRELHLGSLDHQDHYVSSYSLPDLVQKHNIILKAAQQQVKKDTLSSVTLENIVERSLYSSNNEFTNVSVMSLISSIKFNSQILKSLSVLDLRANGYSSNAAEEIYSLVRSSCSQSSIYSSFNTGRNETIESLGLMISDDDGNVYVDLLRTIINDMNSRKLNTALKEIKTEGAIIHIKENKLNSVAESVFTHVNTLCSNAQEEVNGFIATSRAKRTKLEDQWRKANTVEEGCQVFIEEKRAKTPKAKTRNSKVQTDPVQVRQIMSLSDADVQTEVTEEESIEQNSVLQDGTETPAEVAEEELVFDIDKNIFSTLECVNDDCFLTIPYDSFNPFKFFACSGNSSENKSNTNSVNGLESIDDVETSELKSSSDIDSRIVVEEGRLSVGNTLSMILMCGVIGKKPANITFDENKSLMNYALWLTWDMDKICYASVAGDKDADILKAMQTSSRKTEISPSDIVSVKLLYIDSSEVVITRYSENNNEIKEFRFIPFRVHERGNDCCSLMSKKNISLGISVAESIRFVASLPFEEEQTSRLIEFDSEFHKLAHIGCSKVPSLNDIEPKTIPKFTSDIFSSFY